MMAHSPGLTSALSSDGCHLLQRPRISNTLSSFLRRMQRVVLRRPTQLLISKVTPAQALLLPCRSFTAGNQGPQPPQRGGRSRIVVPEDEAHAEMLAEEQEHSRLSRRDGQPESYQGAVSGAPVLPRIHLNTDSSASWRRGKWEDADVNAVEGEDEEEALMSSQQQAPPPCGVGPSDDRPIDRAGHNEQTGRGDDDDGVAPDPVDKSDFDSAAAIRHTETWLAASETRMSAARAARQEALYATPVEDLVDAVTHYLRATINVRLVSADEEHDLFPVLLDRLDELSVQQMLSVVESHWARSTLARYGVTLKDLIRDRIAQLATAAAAEINHSSQRGAAAVAEARGVEEDGLYADGVNEEEEEATRMAPPSQENSRDVILARAAAELSPEAVLRCIVVMGISAGHRKRDVRFFEMMGAYFTFYVNHYKDPHHLVHVLTAFSRAKIVPSQSFLALVGRRLPVLAKRTPLEPLPCYRAMSNLARMGHTHMDTFRFLSDCLSDHIQEALLRERKQFRIAELRSERNQKQQRSEVKALSEDGGSDPAPPPLTDAPPTAAGVQALVDQVTAATRAKQRLHTITGLKPSMLTRWLAVLAHLGAPHQQYLRPLVEPLLVPILPHLPPPSFSRLVAATRTFRSTDMELVEPLIAFMATTLAPQALLQRRDVMNVLILLSLPDTPAPRNLDVFVALCHRSLGSAVHVGDGSPLTHHATLRRSDFVIRPRDMCVIANAVWRIQMKVEIQLEMLAPLTELLENFAERLSDLLKLGVVSLEQVEMFLRICEAQQHPDTRGSLARLTAQRAEVARGGDEEYYTLLDIDVRDTFERILIVNDIPTYGTYRPLPGPLQVDFREELTKVSALDLLRAVNLHEQVNPGTLRASTRRLISRAVLMKLGPDGEEVQSEDGRRLELRPPQELPLTREDLQEMVELLQCTPLRRVRESPLVWAYVRGRATRLHATELVAEADARLHPSA